MKTSLLGILFLAFLNFPTAAAQNPRFTDVTNDDFSKEFSSLWIWFPEPKEDGNTGFIIRGKNPSSVIAKLSEINGRSIADLERDMRPGAASTAGFLGTDESLLEVMEGDNRFVVDDNGLSHQKLALHMCVMAAVGCRQVFARQWGKPISYHGRVYSVSLEFWFDAQGSPFCDDTKSGIDVEVTNLDNNERIWYSLLVPMMIDRYGFYEGKGTKYRVEPDQILKVFDFMKVGALRKDSKDHEEPLENGSGGNWIRYVLGFFGAVIIGLLFFYFWRKPRDLKQRGHSVFPNQKTELFP